MKKTRKLLTLTALGGLLAPGAYAQFNKLEAWGDAAGTTPAPSFTSGGGASTISAGGADFWGGSDQGAYLWDTNGNMTRTGDFTASVRHVSTNSPAPEWGRDGILVRAISGGAPAANDPNWLAMARLRPVAAKLSVAVPNSAPSTSLTSEASTRVTSPPPVISSPPPATATPCAPVPPWT